MNAREPRRGFKHGACGKCGGDAFLDLGDSEWRCLQCGKSLMPYSSIQSEAWSGMVRRVAQKPPAERALTSQP
jgi:hypothetical protein